MYERKTGYNGCGRGSKDWVAEVPTQIKPDVKAKPQLIDGEMMYVGKGKDKGKFYKQDLFDKRFKVIPGKIKSRFFRGSAEKVLQLNAY